MKDRDLDRFFQRLATDDLLTDEAEREAFKEARPALRRELDRHPFVQLDPRAVAPELVSLEARRSERIFSDRPVAFGELSSLLAVLAPKEKSGRLVHRHPSAGGAYAVQVYLQSHPDRIEGVPAGTFHHRADLGRLVLTSREPAIETNDHFPLNRAWVERGAFTIVLVADLAAIRPLYGKLARDFCLLEAGAMMQLLQTAAPALGLGLCQSGVVDFARARSALMLGDDHEILAAMVGGPIGKRLELAPVKRVERPTPAAPQPRPKAPERTPRIEAELTELWEKLLGEKLVDPNALFFDIGATSIMAARAVRELQERYPEAEIDVADIFAHPSVRSLSIALEKKLGLERDEAPEPTVSAETSTVEPARFDSCADPRLAAIEAKLGRRMEQAEAHQRTEAAEERGPEPVAIVGIAVRAAGAPDTDAFWQLLVEGRCTVGPQPEHRRALVPRFRPRADQSFNASYLADLELFDPASFHMSPREAERVDPAQRLMLEVTADLLASSGYLGRLAGTRTGVFLGASRGDYAELRDRGSSDLSRLLPGNMAAIIANRISHFFDLSGPSVVIDTACSSSLVAVDQAVRALQSGDVEAAIAGGVNVLLSPEAFEAFRQDGMESHRGLCRTFDAGADGFVRGEGAAAVLLKPYSAARRDGDHVFALIRGSATNHDGRTSSLPVPSPLAQRDVIELAHRRAKTTPAEIDYVEAHGTGTKLGDPIEVRGLTEAFRPHTDERSKCGIGSVKTNLGHLEFAAGVMGLVKTALSLERGAIPASLHFESPNPHLDLAASPFFVVDRLRDWPDRGRPRRAAVSSFGVGGTNAHVILEEAPRDPRPRAEWERPVHLVVVSAPDRDAFARAIRMLRAHVERHREIDLGDLAYTLLLRPAQLHRAAFVVRDREQLLDHLSLAIADPESTRVVRGAPEEEPKLEAELELDMKKRFAELTDGGKRALRRYAPDRRLSRLFGDPIEEDVPPPASLCRQGWIDLYTILAQLWVRGFTVDLEAIDRGFVRKRAFAPPLSLRRERCWWPVPSFAEPKVKIEAPVRAPDPPKPAPVARSIGELLRERIGRALRIAPERVNPKQPLVEMGMDSLAVTELIGALRDETGLELEPSFFFENPTLEKLALALEAKGASLAPPRIEPVRTTTSIAPPAQRIAVVGMAGRLPGARDLNELWSNLKAGRDSISEVPRSRFDVDALFDPDPKSTRGTYGRWGGFLDGIDEFDPAFFRIPDREARAMDPQQRLLLMTAWEAVEDAGLARRIFGSKTGVYVGASYTHHRDRLAQEGRRFEDAHAALDNHNAILANRVSYFLDLRGPCLTIDTLCSSSLVAVHSAIRALRAGEIENAIVAGVHVALSPSYYEAVSRLGALSPDGRCRTFDAKANGYVPGEGVIALVLKPLDRAIADGDRIHAVLLGSAVNHGGQSAGLTVPNPAAQAEVVRAALSDAAIEGTTISYVEAHGTGTSLGDPVEVSGLKLALAEGSGRRQFCGIGSLKSNVGHLEPAAGVASIVKVILAMKHRLLPPTLHLDEPNGAIAFEDGPLYVVDRPRAWRSNGPRRAGVSSFGLGGTNAHVVLEEAPPAPPRNEEATLPSLFVVSAKDDRTLLLHVERMLEMIRTEGRAHPLADLCFSATDGRAHFAKRIAIVPHDHESLERGLEAALQALRSGARPPRPEGDELAHRLARDFLDGAEIDPSPLFRGARRVSLPLYPFALRSLQRAKHPFASIMAPANGGPPGSSVFVVRGGDA